MNNAPETEGIFYHYTASGLDNLYLKNGYVMGKSAYGIEISFIEFDALHDQIALALIAKKEPLSVREMNFLLIEMDLSFEDVASLIDSGNQPYKSPKTVNETVPERYDELIRRHYIETHKGVTNVDGEINTAVWRSGNKNIVMELSGKQWKSYYV